MSDRVFGHIAGFPAGAIFPDRASVHVAGVHRPPVHGISGSKKEGADSIVLSGGYEDDEDFGDEIIYTGYGGRNQNTGKQVADQELDNQNMALAISAQQGLPVRVVRGAKHKSDFAPAEGYQYAGLYRIVSFWHETGQAGYRVWRYRLIKHDGQSWEGEPEIELPTKGGLGTKRPGRITTTITRVIRDTALSRRVKQMHKYTCQFCGERLEGPAGPYAEGAHIRPLGKPHNGPDTLENLLCLCPNHHYLFDVGAIGIDPQYQLIGMDGRLKMHPKHEVSLDAIEYHRTHYGLHYQGV